MGKGFEETFFQRYRNEKLAHKRTFNITNHQRHGNQNHERLGIMATTKQKLHGIKVAKKLKPLCIVGRKIKRHHH
jgi:hypothetical protein